MKIEVFSHPKDRSGRRAGDDIVLSLPGKIHGVFDGATDALGTKVNGESVGRIAARTVAAHMARVALDPVLAARPGAEIIKGAAAELGALNRALALPIPASTTIAAVFEEEDAFRILVFGDSGVRVNGQTVHTHHKRIDDVSTTARVFLFRLLRRRCASAEETERLALSAILLGFTHAVETCLITAEEAARTLAHLRAQPRFADVLAAAEAFVTGGIRTQFTHANKPASPLGYGSMNGTPPLLGQMIDTRIPRADVRTLELFTDGYFALPEGTEIADWERLFRTIERRDPHKTGRYRGVKGSTASDFSDDRTILSIRFT